MKKNNYKSIISLIARAVVGGVLIYAGFLKASAPPEEFAFAIDAYKIFPPFMIFPVALAVPWFEIYLGSFLAFGLFKKASSILTICLFLFFETLLISAIIRGLPLANCGCFATAGSNSATYEFIQNLVFIWLAFLAYKWETPFSLDKKIESLK